MGQYLSACFSSDATDDDAYDLRDLEFLEDAKILLKDDAVRAVDAGSRYNHLF